MAKGTVANKLIESHLTSGDMTPGSEIGLRIDQTLTQDATGTMVMLELEAMDLDGVRTEVSVQYVDHNLLQTDFRNADDHLFLESAARRFGLWFSKPGNGVSHPVHQMRFGIPGKTLLGSDSHTPAAGAIGMLAMGAGGLEVAMAMAGEPFHVRVPQIWGVKLTGELPDWVSAKDVILEMLRRHDVDGGVGKIIEYYGPGLANLTAWDRHVIANMGAELGATTTVFPSDDEVKRFFHQEQRSEDWVELVADADAEYDLHEEIDMSTLEPLIALPTSPGNVVPVAEVAGREIYQTVIGSSANAGLRDFVVPAKMVAGRQTHPRVSFDVNPTSRQALAGLAHMGLLTGLVQAGARIHQSGCMGCIGMGQAPATDAISLRTVPRNFPGRSGTTEDKVYLCSPGTATASALTGVITDPRTLDFPCPSPDIPDDLPVETSWLVPPPTDGERAELRKGPNIKSLPEFTPPPESIEAPVLLTVGDDLSTDEISPAGQRALPFRSNIPELAKFCFETDPDYYPHAMELRESSGHFIVGGRNYGQGSSREHAAIAPRYLGLRAVLAVGFARIHWQNLVAYGIVPLTFADPADKETIAKHDVLRIGNLRDEISSGDAVTVENTTQGKTYTMHHKLSDRQREILLAGGLINEWRQEQKAAAKA